MVLDGTADELRDNEDVKEFYLGGAGYERKSFNKPEKFQTTETVAVRSDGLTVMPCLVPGIRVFWAPIFSKDADGPDEPRHDGANRGNTPMTDHYDIRETRDPAEREAELLSWLPDVLRKALAASAYAERLKGVDPARIDSRSALAGSAGAAQG